MNPNMIINYKQVLENIYHEASDEDKAKICTMLGTLFPPNGPTSEHAKQYAVEIIKKYRPEFFSQTI